MPNVDVEYYKHNFPKGTRVIIDYMADEINPVKSGTFGTVDLVDDLGTIHCKFDDGRYIGICPNIDTFRKVNNL